VGEGGTRTARRLAGLLLERLPRTTLTPETTDGRQGFIHPYKIEGMVAETQIHMLLRDFITAKLGEEADLIRTVAKTIEAEYPGAKVDVKIEQQYRNMADGLKNEPRAVE